MKITSFILPVLSMVGVAFAFQATREVAKRPDERPLASRPASSPFQRTLAGAGLIEPSSEFVGVAAPVAGLVLEVAAKTGSTVKTGDLLFRLDTRTLEAELEIRRARVREAEAKLEQLRSAPRAEDLPPLEARIDELEENLKDDVDRFARLEKMAAEGATDDQSLTSARFAVSSRKAQLARAKADLASIKAGTWKPLIVVAESALASAKVEVNAAEVEIARMNVRAPIAGQVLQVNIRAGEYVKTQTDGPAPVILGETTVLHVRADVDESDAPRFSPTARARGNVRGAQRPEEAFDLEFVRVEPYVVPKKSLTGSVIERVDTRVLQVIYRIVRPPTSLNLYCGQQVDTFIEGRP